MGEAWRRRAFLGASIAATFGARAAGAARSTGRPGDPRDIHVQDRRQFVDQGGRPVGAAGEVAAGGRLDPRRRLDHGRPARDRSSTGRRA